MINIEKLHELIEQKPLWREMPRGCGRTFTELLQAVQSADVVSDNKEPSTFVHISHSHFMAVSCLDVAADIAKELGIKFGIKRTSRSLCVGNSTILFTYPPQLNTFLRGRKLTNYFVDHFTSLHPQDYAHIFSRIKV